MANGMNITSSVKQVSPTTLLTTGNRQSVSKEDAPIVFFRTFAEASQKENYLPGEVCADMDKSPWGFHYKQVDDRY